MKSLGYISIIMTLFISFSSCREDFEILANFKEIPIIYGILNEGDSIHYIRISRAYINDEKNALIIAKDPDSIYYPDVLTVTLLEKESGISYTFERVNGDTIGLPKQSGTFASVPNILYRFQGRINHSYTYKLTVSNSQTGIVNTAETALVGEFKTIVPHENYVVNWFGDIKDVANFRWRSAANANIYEMWLQFNYYEIDKYSGDSTFHSKRMNIFKNMYTPVTSVDFTLSNEFYTERFFSFIKASVPEDKNKWRYPYDMSFDILAGGEVLGNYINSQQAKVSIIEWTITTEYTNIEEGLGIFSSRSYNSYPAIIGANLRDSLAHGVLTRHLNFKN